MADSKIPKVFISSTLEDLADFRQAAQDAILRLGWQPINCGYWAAGGYPPLATCLEKVDAADAVVAIVAHRHGWTPQEPPGDGKKSITRLECERAKELRREVIPFLVDERAPWDAERYEFYTAQIAKPEEIDRVLAEVRRNLEALKEFKAWLSTIGTRVQFATPDQLKTEVLHALTEWGKRQGVAQTTASGPSVRARYLEWLRRTCESVELLGLDLKETQNVRLGQVYVPAVTAPKVDRKGDERKAEFGRERQPDLLLHRLGEESLYVPGAPGAGKSTFCRWLALAVACGSLPPHPVETPEGFEEQLPDDLRVRFPLLCRLREWAGHSECLAGNGHWTGAELEEQQFPAS